jgi:integrase/recombinase XerD
MTELRKRFIDDMRLRGFSERTIEAYVRSVRQLTQHFHKSPDEISEEELRRYFLYNNNIRKWSRAASTISLCGIKFFFTHTLQKEWTTFKLVRPPKEKTLPPILSKDEVRRIIDHVRQKYHRACFIAIYSLGLRLQEATRLHVADIDSDRMFVHIHRGKGSKEPLCALASQNIGDLKRSLENPPQSPCAFPGARQRPHSYARYAHARSQIQHPDLF